MAEEKKTSTLETSIADLKTSLIDNGDLQAAIANLAGTVNTKFDELDEKLDSNVFDFGDQSSTTFAPVTDGEILSETREKLIDENSVDTDVAPTVINIINERDESEPIEIEAPLAEFNTPRDVSVDNSAISSPVLPEAFPAPSDAPIVDMTPVVDAVSELSDAMHVSPNSVSGETPVPNEVKLNNIPSTSNDAPVRVNEEVPGLPVNPMSEILGSNDIYNNDVITNTYKELINSTSASMDEYFTEKHGDLTENVYPVNAVDISNSDEVVPQRQEESNSPMEVLHDVITPVQTHVDLGSNVNNLDSADDMNPIFNNINVDNMGSDEQERIIELANQIEQSPSSRNIAEMQSIKSRISKRDTPESIFVSNNFKDGSNGDNESSVFSPKITVENTQEINATLGDDATVLFKKMIRQLVKLNKKFDDAFGDKLV